ncbi:MAG: ATP-binding protein [Pseudomonadota bacterium]
MEIKRTKALAELKDKLDSFPIVGILGPRQCGKTTLAHQFAKYNPTKKISFFDLEDPRDVARLENPMLVLEPLEGIVVIDEIQRNPELFPVLRVLVDKKKRAKFIILGSASPYLVKESSESLAGRIAFLELGGFSLDILKSTDQKKLWVRGGFPRSFLAKSEAASFEWRTNFVKTYLERDIPNLGIQIPARTLDRFWRMLAHYHGQLLNASELGKSFGAADTTIKRYLDILSGTFVIRQLQPWYYNTKKRLVKSPKIFFRDSGLFHNLSNIENMSQLEINPKLGASWEGFALEQVIQHFNLADDEIYFWAVHTGADLDLVFQRKGKLWGIEVKYNESPTRTKSMMSAFEELSLGHLWVIYPGTQDYKIDKNITAVGINNLKSIQW